MRKTKHRSMRSQILGGAPDVIAMTRDPSTHPYRYKYNHGIFIEELRPSSGSSEKWFDVYQAGYPTSISIGSAKSLKQAERIAAGHVVREARAKHPRVRRSR